MKECVNYIGIVVRRYSVYLILIAFFLLITHVLYRPESETATNTALNVALAVTAGDLVYALDVLTAVGAGRFLTRGNIICSQIFLY